MGVAASFSPVCGPIFGHEATDIAGKKEGGEEKGSFLYFFPALLSAPLRFWWSVQFPCFVVEIVHYTG